MKEYAEIEAWSTQQRELHQIPLLESLPSPGFFAEGRSFVSFSTNNYLALATSQRLIRAAHRGIETFGVANCESRLLGGDLEIYRNLEAKIARMKKKDGALLFATGYLTNLGVLSSLVRSPQLYRFYGFRPSKRYKYAYFTDELNHISIREGIRASEAERLTYRHLDLNHLEHHLSKSNADTKIIVSDGVFSQDGDIVPLPHVLELANKYDAIVYIDDAHGTGILGKNGGGVSEHFGCYDPRIIHMGTLSKAYGSIGGFIAADASIVQALRLSCSAYGFTSTLPPDQVFVVSEAIDAVLGEPERRARLWANQKYLASRLESFGYQVVCKNTPIIPVIIGDEELTDLFSRTLREHGFHVDSVKFPAVARGKSRLRFMANANHTLKEINGLLSVMERLAQSHPCLSH